MNYTFAKGTTVSPEKSRAELDSILLKHGASSRGIIAMDDKGVVIVGFVMRGLQYRMEIPMPRKDSPELAKAWVRARTNLTKDGWITREWEQACRERWRGIVLLTKAKLELVKLGISTIEKEFMADLVLPNGDTVNKHFGAEIGKALATGKMTTLALPESTS